ncbi:MAG: ribosome-binding ATPase YchF [Candidatus Micrarchaeota archaeon]|nr:MAG: ribosome-binding ATPase YchF [Candidatus Micrarchaeota archaeon]
MVSIGIIGAPNKGKSTLFSSLTLNEVAIANYPFTTIKPNKGIAYLSKRCVESDFNTRCNARDNLCIDGTRLIPINIIDTAGLVKGAHQGRGMGNQFLNDISGAEGFIIVADLSGKTDQNGNPCDSCNPVDDVEFIIEEIVKWLSSILKRNMPSISRIEDGPSALQQILSSFKLRKEQIEEAIEQNSLSSRYIRWSNDEIEQFSRYVISRYKSFIVAANKDDLNYNKEYLKELESRYPTVHCSADIELALRRADQKGIISYRPWESRFRILKETDSIALKDALSRIEDYLVRNNGTHVQELINRLVFDIMKYIVVYPVENENSLSDSNGNILLDAILLKEGSTAEDLAYIIHSDLAKNMLYAIDARSKMRIPKEYILKDNDIIKIVSKRSY